MNLETKPVYIYTLEQLKDFWTNHSGKNIWINNPLFQLMLLQPGFTEYVISNPEKFLDDLVEHFKLPEKSDYEDNNIDVEALHEFIWWLNVFFLIEFNKSLLDDDIENFQWYFCNPDHPFEQYLVKNITAGAGSHA